MYLPFKTNKQKSYSSAKYQLKISGGWNVSGGLLDHHGPHHPHHHPRFWEHHHQVFND
jgi:hypothetical protein